MFNFREMDDFDRIRNLIRHENELINQRLTWLGTFQGLLLAALAFAWDKKMRAAWCACFASWEQR